MDITETSLAVERGILRAVWKLFLIGFLIAIIGWIGYYLYTSSESYQDAQAQQEMIDHLRGIR